MNTCEMKLQKELKEKYLKQKEILGEMPKESSGGIPRSTLTESSKNMLRRIP